MNTRENSLFVIQKLSKSILCNHSSHISDVLKEILEMIKDKTISVELLVSPLVRLVASKNTTVKTLSCECLCLIHENVDNMGLSLVNTLNNDLKDPNPLVRLTAVTTLCCLPGLEEFATPAIRNILKNDQNPLVRKAAVTGCGKLWRHNPAAIMKSDLVDLLYTQVRDPDPSVLTFAIQTLDIILESEGGIVINSLMANYLLQERVPHFQSSPQICFILEHLRKRYKPLNCQFYLDVLNSLDQYLNITEVNFNAAIVLSAARLAYSCALNVSATKMEYLLKNLTPRLIQILKTKHGLSFEAVIGSVAEFLMEMDTTHTPQVGYSLAEWIERKPKASHKFCRNIVSAICHIGDASAATQVTKFIFLRLQNDESGKAEALELLCCFLKRFEDLHKILLNKLTHIATDNPALSSLILFRVRNLSLRQDDSKMLRLLLLHPITDYKTTRNVLWLLIHFSASTEVAPLVLDRILNFRLEESSQIRDDSQLLLAGVCVFSIYPAQTQYTLSKIFRLCVSSDILAPRVHFYSKLLQQNFEAVRIYLSRQLVL